MVLGHHAIEYCILKSVSNTSKMYLSQRKCNKNLIKNFVAPPIGRQCFEFQWTSNCKQYSQKVVFFQPLPHQ